MRGDVIALKVECEAEDSEVVYDTGREFLYTLWVDTRSCSLVYWGRMFYYQGVGG